MNTSRSLITATVAVAMIALGLTACQPQDVQEIQESAAVAEQPERIASLSYETTEILAELGLEDRIVIMPESVLNPALGSHQEQLAGVETTYAVEKELTAEAVIDVAPDLVLMTPRHGAEDTIATVLEGAGIETLMTPNGWSTTAELAANIRLVGDAVGEGEKAEELASELETGLTARASAHADAPRILVLSNQAGRPFITAGTAFPLELVDLAGGSDVGKELGIEITGPIQVEQIIAADPDGIILIDMNGSGDRLFQDVLANEAVQQLRALTEDRVFRVQGKEVQALGLTGTIAGLDRIADWLVTVK